MTWAITIGCYRLVDFIELSIKRCLRIFGDDCQIILSDDKSPESGRIREVADRYSCFYHCSKQRRSHFSGDIQSFVTAIEFSRLTGCDAALKLSQRLIPVLPKFRTSLEAALQERRINVALPGRMNPNQVARPQAKFYARFGFLTDVVAIRTGSITPEELIDTYRERFRKAQKHHDCLVETTWGHLLAHRFKDAYQIVHELTNHVPFKPKIYLRKAQSTVIDYQQVAAMEGLSGNYDLREWAVIEGKGYFCRPTTV